jgi:hypothetical protein
MDSWLVTTPLDDGLGTGPIRTGYSRRRGIYLQHHPVVNVCHEATCSMHRTFDTKRHRRSGAVDMHIPVQVWVWSHLLVNYSVQGKETSRSRWPLWVVVACGILE